MSPESMVPVFPLEIIGNIVDILMNDYAGLDHVKEFSRLCKSFLPFCRSHIFSSIKVSTSLELPHNDQAFGQFLLETPGIAMYIRKLNIYIADPHFNSTYFCYEVPQKLTRLESLTVCNPTSTINWNDLSLPMQRCLLTIMHLPTLRHLDLRDAINVLISDLNTCTNLKHLTAHDVCFTHEIYEAASSPMQLQELDLVLEEPMHESNTMWQILDFSGLEKISVTFDDEDISLIRAIFRQAQHLRDISLTIEYTSLRAMELAESIGPSLQSLRRLYLDIDAAELPPDVFPLAQLCDELEKISGKNRLESLAIKLEIDEEYPTGDEWGLLEKVLFQPGWPVLKYVSLDVVVADCCDSCGIRFRRDLLGSLQTQLSGLTSSKDLDFRSSVKSGGH